MCALARVLFSDICGPTAARAQTGFYCTGSGLKKACASGKTTAGPEAQTATECACIVAGCDAVPPSCTRTGEMLDTASAKCVCEGGWWREKANDTCATCPMQFYCTQSDAKVPIACADGTTSAPGSTSAADCTSTETLTVVLTFDYGVDTPMERAALVTKVD